MAPWTNTTASALDAASTAGPLLLTAAASGLTAVAGAVLGSRSLTHAEARSAHHEDFKQNILDPWVRWADVRRGELAGGFSRMLHATFEENPGWSLQIPLGYAREPFPPDTPLWGVSASHWPELHERHEALEREVRRLEARIGDLLRPLDTRVASLPFEWEPERHQRQRALRELGGARRVVGWTDERSDWPSWGRRTAIKEIWARLVEAQAEGAPRGALLLHVQEHPGESILSTKRGSTLAFGHPAPLRDVADALEAWAQDVAVASEVRAIRETAALLSEETVRLHEGVLRAKYRRSLPRRCPFCPRWLRG